MIRAAEVRPGDRVTYCGETFVAGEIVAGPAEVLMVAVNGSYPRSIWAERMVEVERDERPEPRLYYVTGRDAFGPRTVKTYAHSPAEARDNASWVLVTRGRVTRG